MKRNPHLKTLSFEHHEALVMARKISLRFMKTEEPQELIRYVQDIFEDGLDHHFDQEEKCLFPPLNGHRHAQSALMQIKQEHTQLLKLYKKVSESDVHVYKYIREFAVLLHDHIRFEERIFFPLIEKLLTGDELAKIGIILKQEHRPLNKECRI